MLLQTNFSKPSVSLDVPSSWSDAEFIHFFFFFFVLFNSILSGSIRIIAWFLQYVICQAIPVNIYRYTQQQKKRKKFVTLKLMKTKICSVPEIYITCKINCILYS